MSYSVVISPAVYEDLRRNVAWWSENRSREQAGQWKNAILQKILSLDAFPESHARATENEDFPYELRAALFGLGSRPTYRILFRIEGDEVRVLAVRSAAQDHVTADDVEPFEPSS